MIFLVSLALPAWGNVLPPLALSNDTGGKLDGTLWDTSSLKGKPHVIFYVDPDVKDVNLKTEEALKNSEIPKDAYGTVAIINMAATWMPNFAINMALKKKQANHPRTTYVRDLKKEVVAKWGLADDNYDVILVDKNLEIAFSATGGLSDEDILHLIDTLKKLIKK